MANKVETLVASIPLKSSARTFYEMFKNKPTDIASISPANFKEIEVVEGEEGTVGCVTRWTYIVGGVVETSKLKIEEINDSARSITFNVIEGDLLVQYKSFKFIVDVTDGLVKDTFVYEKATSQSPPPKEYVPIVVAMLTHIDAHLINSEEKIPQLNT